jgi:hypothetical protein
VSSENRLRAAMNQAHRTLRRVGSHLVEPSTGFVVEHACGEGIAEDRPAFQRLMERPMRRGAARGMAWLSGLHVTSQTA